MSQTILWTRFNVLAKNLWLLLSEEIIWDVPKKEKILGIRTEKEEFLLGQAGKELLWVGPKNHLEPCISLEDFWGGGKIHKWKHCESIFYLWWKSWEAAPGQVSASFLSTTCAWHRNASLYNMNNSGNCTVQVRSCFQMFLAIIQSLERKLAFKIDEI